MDQDALRPHSNPAMTVPADARGQTSEPFNAQLTRHDGGELALLPSPFATLVGRPGQVRMFGPHGRVHRLEPSAPVHLLFCTPNFIKALLGQPRYFLNQRFSAAELPLLAAFEDSAPADWTALLGDLRAAVSRTHDEYQFIALWRQLMHQRWPSPDIAPERQAERLCKRYAGQAPTALGRQVRLARQLSEDLAATGHRPTGDYSDQSHYIRECRKLTSRTPGDWKKLSARFYYCDGDLGIMAIPTTDRSNRKVAYGTGTEGDGRRHRRQP